jgi:hypothetical protein
MQSKQPNLGAIKIRFSILAPSEKVAAEPKASRTTAGAKALRLDHTLFKGGQ